MSTWLSNGPCPNCGSKDNLATYDDGHQWCWGCGYYVPSDSLEAVRKLAQPPQEDKPSPVTLPHDVDFNYALEALQWIENYELVRSDLLKNRVFWSESSRLLIFPYFDGEGGVIAWQGRNFGEKFRTKWYGRGKLEDTFALFPRGTTRVERIIFVEDVVSAIKVGKVIEKHGLSQACLPLCGSHISDKRLARSLYFLNHSPQVAIWLDYDKARDSVKFQDQASSLGFKATSILTKSDPKELDYASIYGLIQH